MNLAGNPKYKFIFHFLQAGALLFGILFPYTNGGVSHSYGAIVRSYTNKVGYFYSFNGKDSVNRYFQQGVS